MASKRQLALLMILSILLSTNLANVSVVGKAEETESPYDLVIEGLVQQPTNFTYSELQSFPRISEIAVMECITGWTQLYNWTGVPLFFLLSVAGVKVEATEVVFYASDGFSSSLTIERALHPTTLLALQANGKVLSHSDGYPYRLVVPCKYGYKWVKWIKEIEVIDYDYKGYYESRGYSDEADIPGCAFPSTTLSNFAYYDLSDMYSQLQSDYDGLQEAYDSLSTDLNNLQGLYNSLLANYTNLQGDHNTLTDDLGTTRSLSYIFIVTTIIFMATTVYFAFRRSKVEPELENT